MGKSSLVSRWPTTTSDKDKNFLSDYVEGKNQDYKKITNQLQGTIEESDDAGNLKYFANSLPEAVRRLLNTADKDGNPVMTFEQFSTQNYEDGQSSTAFPSIESIHNNLHYFAGGSGYMGNPATAAFDPIFW
jgi:Ca2+-binding EF-hand superfamily protein